MKKRCCSCNNDLTLSNNHDLACNSSKLSLKSDVDIQTDILNGKNIIKSEQTKDKYIDSDILLLKFRNYLDSESITEAKTLLQNLCSSFATMDMHI